MNNYKELIETALTNTLTKIPNIPIICEGIEDAMAGNEYIIEAFGVNEGIVSITIVSGSKESIGTNQKINHLDAHFESGSFTEWTWEN